MPLGIPSIRRSDPGTDSSAGVRHTQFHAVLLVLLGASQLPIALSVAGDHNLMTFVVGSGGWALIAIGIAVFGNTDSYDGWWTDGGIVGLVSDSVLLVLTIAVVAASASVMLAW